MQRAYRAFYWAFDRFSYLTIPRDAGDFSLIDRRVVHAMLQCDERDLFLRGVRAFVGFRQTGVDYVRPKRMFGVTTNSLRRNIGWAKKGIFSFSNVPLTMLSFAGTVLFLLSLVLAAAVGVARLLAPGSAPPGATTVVILVLLFGSLNLFAIGLVGEYLARVFEEVKRRPLYVRSSIVRDGEVRLVSPSVDVRSAWAGRLAMELHFSERRCPGLRQHARARGAPSASTPLRSTSTPSLRASSRSTCITDSSSAPSATCSTPSPVLALDDLGGIYDAAAFDSKQEAECASRTYARLAHSLRGKLPRSEAALDIGTGEGSFLERLLDLGFRRVRGYEPSAAPLAAASPRVRELIVHDVFRPGGPGGGPFDLVTCFQTIEHVPDPAALCRHVLELLRPGGAFLIVCHDRRAPLNRALGRRSPIIDIEHLQLFSQESARALLQRAGFGRVDVRRISNRYPLHYWLKLAPLPAARQASARLGHAARAVARALAVTAGRQPRRDRLPPVMSARTGGSPRRRRPERSCARAGSPYAAPHPSARRR